MKITNLRRDEEKGFWMAEVIADGLALTVDSRHGSWQTTVDGARKDVMPWLASRLQEKVRRLERAEARA